MYPTADEIRERSALIQGVRELGTPEALADGQALQAAFHDEQMDILSKDTYWSAMGNQAPPEGAHAPAGWLRASEHLDLLRQSAPSLAGMSNDELLDYLKPEDSGFRAEIYLPDPAVLGPGFRPVIVPKGSAGEVQMANGKLRDTTVEDFAANNFPQAVGLKTDYYDRGMDLAVDMKELGLNAEYAAHSLGGGVASAMSAVTGQPATTFNAAGLHPETARRFASENPGVQLYDTGTRVTAYQVQGELLNDGIQNNFERMDVLRRKAAAGVFSEAAQLLRGTPAADEMLKSLTRAPADAPADDPRRNMPTYVAGAVDGFLTELATKDTDKLLDELPLAAGRVIVLDPAKTWNNGQTVDRVDQMVLAEVAVLAAPTLDLANTALRSANLGRQLSEAPAAVMQVTAGGLDASGNAVEAVSKRVADFSNGVGSAQINTLQQGVRIGGEALAGGRLVAGQAEAGLDRLQGETQARAAAGAADGLEALSRIDMLPDGVQRWAARSAQSLDQSGEQARRTNQGESRQALQDANADAGAIRAASSGRIVDLERVEVSANRVRSDAITGVGSGTNDVLDTQASGLVTLANKTRDAGTVAGAVVGAASYGFVRTVEATGPALSPAGWSYNAVKALSGAQETDPLQTLAKLSPTAATARLAADIEKTVEFAHQVSPAGKEALARHLMTETVSPTMEARTQALEQRIQAKYPSLGRSRSDPQAEQTQDPERAQATPPQADKADPHPLEQHLRAALEVRGLGKPWDENSERLAASLTVLAARSGFTDKDTLTIGFNVATADRQAGELVFVQRSGPNASPDPAANRAHMAVTEGIARPAAETLRDLGATIQEQQLARQQAQDQQPQPPNPGMTR